VLDRFHFVQHVAGQDVGAPDHVDVAHRAARAELQGVVDGPLEQLRLPVDRVPDRLHHQQEEEGKRDEERHDGEPQSAAV
jgi:hypothetical protein